MAVDPVVVVGAGPAGAGLAWLLATRNVPVVLLERQHDFEREFRGEVMMPGGLHALDEMGLVKELDDLPHRVPRILEAAVGGKLIAEIEVNGADYRGHPITICSQPAMLERFVERCSEHESFTFERGATVREVLFENGRAVGVRCDGDAGSRTIAASLVVGTDGRASIVRKAAPFPLRAIGTPLDIVWAKLPMAAGSEDRVYFHVKGGHLFVGLPAPDGRLQVAWVILKGHFGELRSRGIEEWVGKMADHVGGDLGEHLRTHAGDLTRPFLLDAKTERVSGWSRPGLLLLGDAAHTMSPVGAQGLNVALRDAVVAANHLVPVLREGAGERALDAAAARIEPERGEEIDTIQRLASFPPRVVMGQGPVAAALRRLLSLVGPHLPAPRVFPRVAAPFLFGVSDVRLRV